MSRLGEELRERSSRIFNSLNKLKRIVSFFCSFLASF